MGKHNKVSRKGKWAAVTLGGVALSAVPVGTASADPPGGWGPIIQCESSGNPRAQNPNSTASGLFQFLNSTWRAFGGGQFAPTAKQATSAEQTIVANRAFERNGLSDWNASKSCWQGKTGKTTINSKNASRATQEARKAPSQPGRTHVVKSGDTLSGIAGRNWQALWEKNKNVIGNNPNLIFPGQVLKV